MGIESYDDEANANIAYMPEGQLPSTVNNGVRGVQADLAAWYNDPGWYRPGAPARTCTYLAANSFRDPGGNWTTLYLTGRRARAVGVLTGVIQGTIQSATFAGGNTDIVVNWDGAGLQAEGLAISLGIAPTGATTWVPVAAEGWRGIVELATAAEFAAGTDALRALTPALFGASVANPGYVRLPGGLIVQFGWSVTSGGGFISPEFPTPFTSTIYFLGASPVGSHLSGPYKAHPTSAAEDSFTAKVWDGANASPDGVTVYWLAIGT